MNRKNEGGGFWMFSILMLLGIVILLGGTIGACLRQEPTPALFVQESFTVPVTDKTYSEIAVFGPESEVTYERH